MAAGWQRAPGERVVWRARKGGVYFRAVRVIAALLPAVPLVSALWFAVVRGGDLDILSVVFAVGLTALFSLGLVLLITPPIGRAYVLTDRRLVRENHFSAPDEVPLEAITRMVEVYAVGIGRQPTGTIDVRYGQGRRLRLWHVADGQTLLGLVRRGVLERRLDLSSLLDVDAVGAALQRLDVFFAEVPSWGPVLVGPTRVVRASGAAPPELGRQVLAMLASGAPGAVVEDEMERQAARWGPPLVVPIDQARLSLSGRVLTLATSQWKDALTLPAGDAPRARAFLAAHAPRHPWRDPAPPQSDTTALPAPASLPVAYEFPVAGLSWRVDLTADALSFRGPVTRGEIPVRCIERFGVGTEHTGRSRHGDRDAGALDAPWVGTMALLLVAHTSGRKRRIARVNVDLANPQCQALVQAMRAALPGRDVGIGPALQVRRRMGFSNVTAMLVPSVVIVVLTIAVIGAIGWSQGGFAGSSRTPPGAIAGLRVGDAVEAEWNGAWYPATVLAVQPDGRVRIHYTGWSSTWDETVPRDRFRPVAGGRR